MKGTLKLLVLHLLKDDEYNGYNLIRGVSKYFGKKPSTGTMYPLLNNLNKNGYVERKEQGRSITYKITSKGVKYYHELIKKDRERIKKGLELHGSLFGISELSDTSKGERKYSEICYDVQNLFRKIISSPNFSKVEKELKEFIEKADADLRRIYEKLL